MSAEAAMRDQRGFTLVELLIVVAIAGMIFFGLGSFFVSGLSFYDHATAQADMQRQGALALEAMGVQIREAITWNFATCGGMANALSITNPDGQYCYYQGQDASVTPARQNQIMETPPAATAHNLMKGARFPVTASGLGFTFPHGVSGAQVRITFTLAGGATVYPSTFTLTVKRRN